jgi:PAS domain S-box-containing protein
MNVHPGPEKRRVHRRVTDSDPVWRAFHENEDWYQDLVEHSHDLLCVHDLEGRLLSVNPAPARMLGYSVEELLQIPMREIIVSEFRRQFDAYLNQIARVGEARGLLAVMTRSGEPRIWEYHNTLRTEGVAKPIVRGVAHDVTEQRQTEKLLREVSESLLDKVRESERTIQELKLFRALVDQSNDAIEVVDPETLRFLDVNERACAELGYSREELLTMRVLDIDPAVTDSSAAKIREELRKTGSVVIESVHRRKDGITFPVEVSTKRVQLERDYIVAISRDLTERKLADSRLQGSQNRYRAVHDRAPVGICWVETATGRLLGVNPKYCEILGRTEQDLLSRNFQSLTHPDDMAGNLEKLRQLREGKVRHYEIEKRYLRPDGMVRWAEVEVVAMWPEGEDPVWHMAIVQDVTERREAEEALRTSERRQHKIAKQLEVERARLIEAQAVAKVGSWEIELPSLEITWSEQTHRIFETDPAHFHPRRPDFVEFIHPEDRAKMDAAFQDSLDKGAASNVEYRIVMADGRLKVLEEQWRVFYDEQGRPIRLMGTCRDITERKRAEEALKKSEEMFSKAFRQSPLSITLTSIKDHRYLEVNEAFERMTGWRREEVIGRTPFDIGLWMHPEERVELAKQLLSEGCLRNVEAPFRRKDGAIRSGLGTAEVIEFNGEPCAIAVAADVTERKQAVEALRRSEENYRMFVSQSSEGIFRQDLDAPVSIDLPEDELVHHILHDHYLAECNDALARMYGLRSGQEFVGKRLTETVVADDPHNIELTREFIRNGFRVLDRESHEVDMQGNPKVFLNSMIGTVENGMLVRTWGIQRDVTEKVKLEEARRKADEDLRQSEQRFRIALAGSPITVFNQDRDLRYTWVYNVQEGWSEQDYLGKTDEQIFEPEVAARMAAIKRPVLESGQGTRQEFSLTAHGKTCYCDITVEPLFDAAGQVVGVNSACVDVTRMREITEELRVAKEKLSEEKLYLEQAIDSELGFGEIIGRSSALKEVMEKVAKVAPSDATVLLLGETGTGKELVARALHRLSNRQHNSFIKMNCAAIPSGLLESELFGHEKGAFTGAVARKLGRVELADNGTLFLDEVGEIPLNLQPKLLRVLQDMEFERLGGTQTLKVNFRLLAATNRDLPQSVKEHEFRSDLYYRLNVFPIVIPPLRERREDIRPLIEHFVRKFAHQMKKSITFIPAKTMETLVEWTWPGNIRELENFVERSVILTPGSVLQAPLSELQNAIEEAKRGGSGSFREVERDRILRVLRECKGRLGGPDGAAARLGLKRTTLQSKLSHLGIKLGEYRK